MTIQLGSEYTIVSTGNDAGNPNNGARVRVVGVPESQPVEGDAVLIDGIEHPLIGSGGLPMQIGADQLAS